MLLLLPLLLLLQFLFLFILRFALLCLMPSQVRSIHPFTQPLNLTDTLSVTFHNAINIYNHRRHPHNVQTTPASRTALPHLIPLALGYLLNLTQCQLFLSTSHLVHSHSFTDCFLCRLLSQPDECLTNYDPHGYCVIYSAADRSSFSIAEQVLQVLWTNQNIAQKAVILVSNKADLARSRLVTSEGKYKKRNVDGERGGVRQLTKRFENFH